MLPKELLKIWADACEKSGIKWYLFRETLLCAHGYQYFPAELKALQVAVQAEDFSRVVVCIDEVLPKDWCVETYSFVTKKKTLTLQIDDMRLEIYVLFPANSADEKRIVQITSKIDAIRASAQLRTDLIAAARPVFSKHVNRIHDRICQKAYRKICALLETETLPGEKYYDVLLQESVPPAVTMHPSANGSLVVDGVEYPVPGDYQTYLTDVFGDYKNGLFDLVGCGLSQEEKEALFDHQQKCIEALSFIQSLSEEFGLRYSLIAGSVLGAVRHGGFIPWDDDIDIGIRIEDRERFEEKVKEELPKRLPEGFTFLQTGTNNPYPRMFSKICYNGRCCIDLWPLVPTYTHGIRAELTWYLAKLLTRAHYKKIGEESERFETLVAVFCFFMTDKMIMRLVKHNEQKYSKSNPSAYINLYSIYSREKETILRTWLEEDAVGTFAGIRVPIVGCTDTYLRHLYGDYMVLPAPWKRANKHTDRF